MHIDTLKTSKGFRKARASDIRSCLSAGHVTHLQTERGTMAFRPSHMSGGWIVDRCVPGEHAQSKTFAKNEQERIRDTFRARFPSMINADRWEYRECHCILANQLCEIYISEYCGLVAIDVVPTGADGYTYNKTGIATAWCEKNAAPLLRKEFSELQRIGTFSNGESIYRTIN